MTETSKCFLDSNIWIYALSDDSDEKAVEARGLVDRLDDRIYFTSQVAHETCLILKKKSLMTEGQIRKLISSFFSNCRYVEMSEIVMVSASALRENHSFSYWDSLIAAAASSVGVDILYSEDMQDGFVLDKRLKIVNPFKL